MLFGKFVGFAGCKIAQKYTLGTSFSLKTRSWLSFIAFAYVLRVRAIPIYREFTDSLISLACFLSTKACRLPACGELVSYY